MPLTTATLPVAVAVAVSRQDALNTGRGLARPVYSVAVAVVAVTVTASDSHHWQAGLPMGLAVSWWYYMSKQASIRGVGAPL